MELPAPPEWFYKVLLDEPDTSPLGPAWAFMTCLTDVATMGEGLRRFSWPDREHYWGDYLAAAATMSSFGLRTSYRFGIDAGNQLKVALVPFERVAGTADTAMWRDHVSIDEPELMLRMAWSESDRRFLAYALDGPAGLPDSMNSVAWRFPPGVDFTAPL